MCSVFGICLKYIFCCEYICYTLDLENIGLALEGNRYIERAHFAALQERLNSVFTI